MPQHTFAIQDDQFVLDGKPFQIRCGELHYNRIPRAYWEDRMLKAKAMGLNTICTYIFWNEHEPEPEQWDFSGNLDVAAFVKLAGELGLWVIARPGPYVCSEWEWGGFPYWLATVPNIQIRQNNPEFLALSNRYMKKVGEQLAPLTIDRGGPIFLAQVENEYGSFDADHEYMAAIKQQVIDAGFDCPLFTSDGPTPEMLNGGTLPGVTAVINFGSRAEERFAEFAKFRTNVPRMCGEFWAGWFDHWGCEHHKTSAESQTADMEWFMKEGASFSIYMLHGGTNWGFMNGANSTPEGYRPDVSSYDYDSAITEDGRLAPKWYAFKEVISRHTGESFPEPPAEINRIEIPEFELSESSLISSQIGTAQAGWKSLEELGQGYGYVLYRVKVPSAGKGKLVLEGLQDYTVVMSGGVVLGTLDRRLNETEIEIEQDGSLEILVENTGRVNYSKAMLTERKGIVSATFNGISLTEVTAHAVSLGAANFSIQETNAPALYRGSFELSEVGDTHFDLRGWGKGNVWINGFNLGRHWSIGPQQTTFCPAPFLRVGGNELIVSDLEPGRKRTVSGLLEPILG